MRSRKFISQCAFGFILMFLIAFAPACAGKGGGGGGGFEEGEPLEQEVEFNSSAHADATAEAFNHWDDEVPPEIPVECAKCHSTAGFLDFLGIADSTIRVVDHPVSIDPNADNALDCDVCHNEQTFMWDTVVFPSGKQVTFESLSRWVFCMECHQGRESTVSVNQDIADAAPPDDDTVDADLSFINIHYFAAAATRYGGQAMGGYQYDGKSYDIFFAHVTGVDNCIACHEEHSLEIQLEKCAGCHPNVVSESDILNIRMKGSERDYDGDGNITEGITYEIVTFRQLILTAIQHYAHDVAGVDIAYDENSYPYFFIDTNGNGIVDPAEADFDNSYDSWTARLVKAAYNLQYSLKDPGCSVHNAKYIIEILYDSIEDLNTALALARQVDLTNAHRIDAGHFAGSEEPFRHWDEDEPPEVPDTCSRCHSAKGLPGYIATGTTTAQPLPNGFMCENCHPAIPNFDIQLAVASVTFPSGAVIDSGDNTTNICMTCHQGRESKVSVDEDIAEAAPATDDTVDEDLSFINIHYFAAGATRYGTQVKGGYEYDGKSYDGFFPHIQAFSNCIDCHTTHGLEVRVDECGQCHIGVVTLEDVLDIRMAGSTNDYNGNGNVTEGISFEISGLRDILLTAMQDYADSVAGVDIAYDANSYPYFFIDTNGNGVVDPAEADSDNSYDSWTARLLRAGYNLHYSEKDFGCSAHNAKYIIELLYDSTEDLGADVGALGIVRNDSGHFNEANEPFRFWDTEGAVAAECTRCHAPPQGFDYYLANWMPSPVPLPVSYGLTCDTCHIGVDFAGEAPRKYVEKVIFPGGAEIDNNPLNADDSFICMTCHQGRESKATIDAAIAANDFTFKDVHHLPAGAMQYGSVAMVGYEYDGKSYAGKFDHYEPEAARCFFCHVITREGHIFHAELKDLCKECHDEAVGDDIETIRLDRPIDYDNDGSNTEELEDEIGSLATGLYSAIQTYAHSTIGTDIVYDEESEPYFFIDTNGNGSVDPGENIPANEYNAWDAKLMKAAHNYHFYHMEPGNWAHNTNYIAQLLIDSIEDLTGAPSGFNRP